MNKTLVAFLKGMKTANLVALFNLAQNPEKWKGTGKPAAQVKKFADRATAEKRLLRVMTTWDDAADIFAGYNEFYGDFASQAHGIGIDMPTPEADAPVAAEKKSKPKAEGAPKKQSTPPHLNLRCESCGYYAKTTPIWLKKARLVCPVDPKHGKLLTAEERGEKRGR